MGREARDPQRDEQGDEHRHQAQQEADRARGAGIQTAEEVGPSGAADVACERPAEDDQGEDGADAHEEVEIGPDGSAVA